MDNNIMDKSNEKLKKTLFLTIALVYNFIIGFYIFIT